MAAQQCLICEKSVAGHSTGGTERDRTEIVVTDRDHTFFHIEMTENLLEISRQSAGPAQRVDVSCKARRDQFIEAVHETNASGRLVGSRSVFHATSRFACLGHHKGYADFARSMASSIMRLAAAASPQPLSFTHLPGSRSL